MNETIKNKTTPVMKQFWDIKEKHPNSILLFRMGDFYETFEKDAEITSEILARKDEYESKFKLPDGAPPE